MKKNKSVTSTMTSMLFKKSSKGTVNVLDKDGFDKMLVTGADDIQNMELKTKHMPRRPQCSRKLQSKKRSSGQAASHLTVPPSATGYQSPIDNRKTTNWLTPASHIQMMGGSQTNEDTKEIAACRNMCNSLLQADKAITEKMDKLLEHTDFLKLRKKEMQHKTWTMKVYDPIRRKVLQAVHNPQSAVRSRNLQNLYDQYLDYTNRKEDVFLDTMDKEERYAQALSEHLAPNKVHLPPLRDPLLLQGRKRNEEDQTILRCITGKIYPLKEVDKMNLSMKLPPLPDGRCNTRRQKPRGKTASRPGTAASDLHVARGTDI